MIVIIHGWSDTHGSFREIGSWLAERKITDTVRNIRLADYISLDDDVTYEDLVAAMDKAWSSEGLSRRSRSVDVVVHSTGALITRHWLTKFFTAGSTPIRRLLMLAPANFGSHLAHKGRSFVGRVVKGYRSKKPFQTGTHILQGLELASPYSWNLASRDLFSEVPWYGQGSILCTILVGTTGYSGISAIANENGSDGTVLVSSANLDTAFLQLDFASDPQKPAARFTPSSATVAFARVPGENHSSIAFKDRGPRQDITKTFIMAALTVTDAGFEEHCRTLAQFSEQALAGSQDDKYAHGYQNTVVHLKDDAGADVKDYFLELFVKRNRESNRPDEKATAKLQSDVLTKVHPYSQNPAFRSLLIDTNELERIFQERDWPLCIAITAVPDISQTKTVGYRTFAWDAIDSLKLSKQKRQQFFKPDRNLLVDFKIRREQMENVFRLLPLKR